MAISASIGEISFTDGTTVNLPKVGVTVVVGPNNAGKTLLLNELAGRMGLVGYSEFHVVSDILVERSGSGQEFSQWLKDHSSKVTQRDGGISYSRSGVGGFNPDSLGMHWERAQAGQLEHTLSRFLALKADLEARTGLCAPTQMYDIVNRNHPGNPLQYMFEDVELENRLSVLCEENFGTKVSINRIGIQLALYLGKSKESPFVDGAPNQKYIDEQTALPHLNVQGHGMRNFVGLYLAVAAERYRIILIDEPEAFLHPPQAKAIGRELAKMAAENGIQVIVATHSLDFLRGVLEEPMSDKAIIRISRDEHGRTKAKHLSNELLRDLWGDTLLRYSGVLDGLFYRLTVLCEGDPDCRFFAAVGSVVQSTADMFSANEVNFVPVGGKQRFPVALKALKALDVPVRVLADFDLIRNKGELKRTYLAAGGSEEIWSELERKWNIGVKPIDEKGKAVPTGWLSTRIQEILSEAGPRLDSSIKSRIAAELVLNDSWESVKKAGISSVPHGDVRKACEELLVELAKVGVIASQFGELESLVSHVPGHGPAWVAAVLEGNYHQGCAAAEALLEKVLAK